MENKIERLRESIKSNPNLTEEFKCNLGTLTDTLVTVFPDYDYSNYERVLSSLSVHSDDSINGYSSYNSESNSIGLNTSKIFEDRIDLQHLFLNNILSIGSNNQNKSLDGFNKGLTEVISSTMNNDESMKKLNVLESLSMSIFSKIITPQVLLDSYMNNDIGSLVVELEGMGIEKDEFDKLLECFNNMGNKEVPLNSSFADAEVLMVGMFSKKTDSRLKNGDISYEDISREYDDFGDFLIFSRSELVSMYPHHDFSNLTGFENVKTAIDSAVINSEMIEDVQMTK